MTRDISHIPSPIQGKGALLHIAMKAAERPVAHSSDEPVFHGIEMDVINVSLQVCVVANCVLPETPLPDALRFRTLLLEGKPASKPRENPLLIKLQRDEKSRSPSGNAQIA